MIFNKGSYKKFGAFILLKEPCFTDEGVKFDTLEKDIFKSKKAAWEWVNIMIGESKEDTVVIYGITTNDQLVPLFFR